MKPDWTTLIVLIISLLSLIPAQRVFMEVAEVDRLAIEEQKCIELIEVVQIDGLRWNGENCGKCYPDQIEQGKCKP